MPSVGIVPRQGRVPRCEPSVPGGVLQPALGGGGGGGVPPPISRGWTYGAIICRVSGCGVLVTSLRPGLTESAWAVGRRR